MVLAATLATAILRVPGHANREVTRRLASAVERSAERDFYSLGLRLTLVEPNGASRFTEGTAELDARNERAHVALPPVVAPGGLDLITQGTILFVSVPDARRAALGGARWVRVAAITRSAARGAGVGPLPDPFSVLSLLEGVTGKVRTVGTTEIDGVAVTRYRATTSLDTMAQRVGRDGAASVRALRRLGRDEFPMEVWLDAKGLPRYLAVTADQGPGGRIVAQVRVSGFGEPIVIGIPPNDAVHPATTFSEALALVSG